MIARYRPSAGKAVSNVHLWDTNLDETAMLQATSYCQALTVLVARLVATTDPITCKACLKALEF